MTGIEDWVQYSGEGTLSGQDITESRSSVWLSPWSVSWAVWVISKSVVREGSRISSVVTQEFFSGPYPSQSNKCCSCCSHLCLEVRISLCLMWASFKTSSLCLDQEYCGNIGWFPCLGKMWRSVS